MSNLGLITATKLQSVVRGLTAKGITLKASDRNEVRIDGYGWTIYVAVDDYRGTTLGAIALLGDDGTNSHTHEVELILSPNPKAVLGTVLRAIKTYEVA